MGNTCRKALILLAGMPGSGKSIFALKAKEYGFGIVSLGDIIREEAIKRKLVLDSKNMMSIAKELRRTYGKDIVARLALKRILEMLNIHSIVIVDGIRNLEEVEFLKSNIDAELIIVSIHASPKTRFKRLVERGRSDDPKDWESFLNRDYEELSLGLGNVIALSDVIIVNEGSLQEFHQLIENFFDRVIKTWCT
ncbi:dephospho-CoA kinase [Ignisphaera aggregans DSM 17230]|uniref:Dephospho-CoA kinase n=1 Tax=Ignisphaera aggregans (strain DSM 17230 / JCM 13409 / AQ1.S1) TaxID=583356 RepID=E0SP39_IGNAA|nr:dephospho-CoA kinase [Ignisphaera aggregans DSM 17230]